MLNNLMKFLIALCSELRTQGVFAFLVFFTVLNVSAVVELGQVESTASQEVVVKTETRDGKKAIVVKNLKDPAKASLKVWVSTAKRTDPPILGAASVVGNELVFVPRFPMRSGARFRIEVNDDPANPPIEFQLELNAAGKLPTKITAFYPSSNLIPENALKFYVHFSAPMRKGDIYQYVAIREVGGKQVELPFLEIEQEFWSKDSKRLTLLLDPGRIKRGLKPREEMGPNLVEGKTYELVVSGKWPDADGRELSEDFVKKFKAGPVDHDQPDPNNWKVMPPANGTKKPLAIKFSTPLDHSMLLRSIRILDAKSKLIEGKVSISTNETVWEFVPDREWSSGEFKIAIDNNLEDNCGNSIGRQFDVDMFDKTESSNVPESYLTFRIGK